MTMNRLFSLRPLLLAVLCAASALASPARAAEPGPDVARLLVDADRYRMTDDNLVVETRVTTASPDKERLYTVYAQSGQGRIGGKMPVHGDYSFHTRPTPR